MDHVVYTGPWWACAMIITSTFIGGGALGFIACLLFRRR